jgi:hypothetical protein
LNRYVEEGYISAAQFGFRSRSTTSRVLPLGAGWAVGRRRNLARLDQAEGLGFDLADLVGQDFATGRNGGGKKGGSGGKGLGFGASEGMKVGTGGGARAGAGRDRAKRGEDAT